MAGDRRIIVEVSGGITVTHVNEGQPEKEEVPGSQENIKQKNSSSNKDNTARSLALMAKDRANSLSQNSALSVVNRYFSLSENYMAETDYNNVMTVVNKVKSFASTVSTGASIGGVAGALVAAAAWGTNEFISYQNRMSGYYQALNATNYQTQFDRSRLGLTNEGKGTEN